MEKWLVGQFFPPGYLLLITEIGNLCLQCSNVMYNDLSSGIFFVYADNFVLLEKNLKNKDFASLIQVFKLLLWILKFIKADIKVAQWVNACLKFDLK